MHYAGILVLARPGRFDACVQQLAEQPGVEVHHVDPEPGRIVVVLEAAGVDAQRAGLGRIQRLSEVAVAELVYHYLDDPAEAAGSGPDRAREVDR